MLQCDFFWQFKIPLRDSLPRGALVGGLLQPLANLLLKVALQLLETSRHSDGDTMLILQHKIHLIPVVKTVLPPLLRFNNDAAHRSQVGRKHLDQRFVLRLNFAQKGIDMIGHRNKISPRLLRQAFHQSDTFVTQHTWHQPFKKVSRQLM